MKLTQENIIDIIKKSKSLSAIIKSLNKNNILKQFIISKTDFLFIDVNLKQRLYHIKKDLYHIEKCDICGKNNKEWNNKFSCYKDFCSNKDCKYKHNFENRNQEEINNKIKKTKIEKYGENYAIDLYEKSKTTCLEKYGVDHYTKTEEYKQHMINTWGYFSPFEMKETHDKSKITLIEKYGVDHNMKIKEVVEKREITCYERYGVNVPTKCDEIKEKVKKTNIEKFGFVSAMCNDDIQRKSRETCLKNHGVEYPLQSKEITSKMLKTMVEKYGVEYWIQNDDLFNSHQPNLYRYYEYILPNNEIVFIQGYEDVVLTQLLDKYDIQDILIRNKDITNNIGKISYTQNNNIHYYYPDFYIKSENKIIEVKSTYTYECEIKKNKLKEQACIDMGLNFEFIIFTKDEYKKIKNQYGITKNKN